MSEADTLTRFDVIFDAEGVNAHKFRNDVTVRTLLAFRPPTVTEESKTILFGQTAAAARA